MEKPQKKAELVIEENIIKAIHHLPELMYRNKNRFEMILSQSNQKLHFQKIKAVFKGRFICKNNDCLQDKRHSYRKQRNDSDGQYEDIHEGWMSWWKKQSNTIKPQLKEEGQYQQKQIQDALKVQKIAKNQLKQNSSSIKKKYIPKEPVKQVEKLKEKQNTRWSSSLTYVIMHYYSYPEPLDKLKKVYNRKNNNKCQIYFYIQILGQKCNTCNSQGFCYPFFGKTELKRMQKNFSSYIFNKIEGKPILRYKPCPLKRLKGHKKQLCQACELGQCSFKG